MIESNIHDLTWNIQSQPIFLYLIAVVYKWIFFIFPIFIFGIINSKQKSLKTEVG